MNYIIEKIKSNLDSYRSNISKLEELKFLLNTISSKISITDSASYDNFIPIIEEFNKLATTYTNAIYSNPLIFEDFILDYLDYTINTPSFNEFKDKENLENIADKITQNENTVNDNIEPMQNEYAENANTEIEQNENTVSNDVELTQNEYAKNADAEIVQNENTENKDVILSEPSKEVSDNDVAHSDTICDNKTLLISEIQNKVLLPYRVSDLQKELKKSNTYKNIEEIIENEYTFTLDKYKNAILSRFREAFNLMRKKENSSILDSLDLALELSFNSLLNPAIISACRNLDELDIYLDYLNSNELDKFDLFEIKYEILPR